MSDESHERSSAREAAKAGEARCPGGSLKKPGKLTRKDFESQLEKLEVELVKLQSWVQKKGLKVIVVFEGS